MTRTTCWCPLCALRRLPVPVEHEPARKAVGEGSWGARGPGSRSRYREHVAIDLFIGRRAGGHPSPRVLPMPLPECIEQKKTEALLLEVAEIVSSTRVSKSRPGDYRDELIAQTCVEFFAAPGADLGQSVRQAFERAQKNFRKQYRTLA